MKHLKSSVFISVISLALFALSCNTKQESKEVAALRDEFKNPPRSARAKVYWWWLNGHVDSVRLKTELQAIKDAGLGGVDIFEIGLRKASDEKGIIPSGPPFMGDESLKMIQLALKEAARLDLEVGIGVASSWNAGGTWVEPKHAAKTIYASKTEVVGGKEVKVKLAFPKITPDRNGNPRKVMYQDNGRPVYSEEIAVVALPKGQKNLKDTTHVHNLSAYFNTVTDELTWQAPAGKWEVYRYICSNSGEQLIVPSPNSAGPIIDHFDSSATRMHMEYFIERLKPLVGGDFKTSTLKNLYLASYEAKEFAWTPTLPAMYKKLHGYDIYKFIPAIYDATLFEPVVNEAFQFDFTKTFSELMINNHYAKSKEICNAHGLQIISESGGPGHLHHIPVETLKALGVLDVPRGEFWYNREFFKEDSIVDYIWLVKEIAAASHIYQRGIVEEEAFTSYWDWQESPKDLKIIADRAFAEGMNRLVIHGFTHNPSEFGYPGIVYLAGTHYNDKVTWFNKSKAFNDYLARVSHILQKADFAPDVLYYYGDKVPNLVPPKNTRFKVGDGYDYEVINTDKLNNLSVENGEVVLPGVARYKVLALANLDAMDPEALAKLKALAEQGATIVGTKPVRKEGLGFQPQSTQQVESEANQLWIDSGNEKGKIYSHVTPLQALQEKNVQPDFSYASQATGALDWIHYTKAGTDFYFIRNTTAETVSETLSFRQNGKAPELWNPVTGEITSINVFESQQGKTNLPLAIPPYGSCFIVFTNKKASATSVSLKDTGISYTANGYFLPGDAKEVAITGEWSVAFTEKWGGPATTTFPTLISWPESQEQGIKYFSGTATYTKEIEFSDSVDKSTQRVYLNLGELAELAEVWVNNKPVGVTWTRPFRVDVTNAIETGTNTIKVEVVNTWSNRLTGDALTGEKFTQTNLTNANKNLVPWKDLPLKKSGLFGPVKFELVTIIK